MNGREAAALFIDLFERCDFPFRRLCLRESILTNPEKTGGYELHIKDHFTDANRDRIKAIAKRHDLSVEKKDGHLIVYKPRKK